MQMKKSRVVLGCLIFLLLLATVWAGFNYWKQREAELEIAVEDPDGESLTLSQLFNTSGRLGKDYRGAVPLKPAFLQAPPQPIIVPPGLSCYAAKDELRAYFTYQMVFEALKKNTRPAEIAYLDCFVPGGSMQPDVLAVREKFLSGSFDADVMYSYLNYAASVVITQTIQQGDLRHGKLAWASGHLGSVALTAYERTGQIRFVTFYLGYFEKLMALRDSVLLLNDEFHGRVMDAWGSANLGRNSGDPSIWVAHVTHFSVIMVPATGFALRIQTDPALAAYRPQAKQIIAFFDTSYPQFDVDLRQPEGTSEKWYWRPLIDQYEATNHLHVQGEALLNMYLATGNPVYADRIRAILRIFAKGVKIDEKGFASWNYNPYFQTDEAMGNHNGREQSEFVWKGGLTIPFLYKAKKAGFEVDAALMTALTHTVRDWVVADNTYKRNVNPKNSGPINARRSRLDSAGPAASITGFLQAADADPAIAERIRQMVATRLDLFPDGWFASDKMARGYAYFLN